MNKKQKTRLITLIIVLLLLASAAGLVLYALKQNINLFYTPTQLQQSTLVKNQILRVGGYVKNKSVHYDSSGQTVSFTVTDNKSEIHVLYHGVLPNLFREGQGVVMTGKMDSNFILQANQVLAKHDEKYMPWSIEKELRKS